MKISISAKNLELTDELTAYVEKRMTKISHFFKQGTPVNVVLRLEKTRVTSHNYSTEVTVTLKHAVVRAEETGETPESATDAVQPIIIRQLRRVKTRYEDRRKLANPNSSVEASIMQQLLTTDELDEDEKDLTLSFGQVVKTKTHMLEPLEVEDAVSQMEFLGHGFYVFRNKDSGQVNVVYRRYDGDYGLIVPG